MAALAAGPAVADVVYYPSTAGINLFKHVNAAGQLDTKAEWVNVNNGGSAQYGALYTIDSGHWQSQINYNGLDNSTNAASLRLELATPQAIGTLTQYIVDIPSQYQVWGFNDVNGVWDNLSDGWQTGSGTIVTEVNDVYKYIQFDYVGTAASHLRVSEVVATPMAGTQIAVTDGYNLFAFRPDQGGPGPVPLGNPLYVGGWRVGSANNPNDLVNNAWNSGMLVQENDGVNANVENFFVVPLNDLYRLVGFATGSHHGQGWSGITVQYTADLTIDEKTVWITAYSQSTPVDSITAAFTNGEGEATPIEARYIRVSAPTLTAGNGAMSSFELYATAIPEPMTMSLLALGGLALLRRRK